VRGCRSSVPEPRLMTGRILAESSAGVSEIRSSVLNLARDSHWAAPQARRTGGVPVPERTDRDGNRHTARSACLRRSPMRISREIEHRTANL